MKHEIFYPKSKVDNELGGFFKSALDFAKYHKNVTLHEDHVFFILISKSDYFNELLKGVGLDDKDISRLSHQIYWSITVVQKEQKTIAPDNKEDFGVSKSYLNMLVYSLKNCKKNGRDKMTVQDVFLSIFDLMTSNPDTSLLVNYFSKEGINKEDAVLFIEKGVVRERNQKNKAKETYTDKRETLSMLSKFTKELTSAEHITKTDPVIGRDDEVEKLINILSQRKKGNPILVGDAGVGKTSVVEALAQRIYRQDVPESVKEFKIYNLNILELYAGTRFRGDYEDKITKLLNEVKRSKNNILFIDEIHVLVSGEGRNEGGVDVASEMLKPVLSSGEIKVIGATTYKEYRKFIESNPAFSRRFQKIDVEEPSSDVTKKIIKGVAYKYENFHGVKYDKNALNEAVDLSIRYMSEKKSPDKAIDIIDAAGAYVKIQGGDRVDIKAVQTIVSNLTGVPVNKLESDGIEQLKGLGADIKKRIYGQDKAVDSVVNTIIYNKALGGIKDKPIGVFMFSGKTGVGKTELAKVVADRLAMNFIRFDMSEFMEKHSVSKLIGSPPGYVDSKDGGQLTERVNKNKHSVVLFDEIEKANADVLNTLLQVMDYGFLTDSKGDRVDFRDAIIIMTTNLGADAIGKSSIGFQGGDHVYMSNEYNDLQMSKIKEFFSPEFINRIDDILVFNELSRVDYVNIARKYFDRISDSLLKYNVKIRIDENVFDLIFKKSNVEKYGARPIERFIESNVAKPLSKKILFNGLKDTTVYVSSCNDEINLSALDQLIVNNSVVLNNIDAKVR